MRRARGWGRCHGWPRDSHKTVSGKPGRFNHLNLVDEVTQFQFIGSCERITERFVVPVLEGLLGSFPFTIEAFHADNGSEFINHQVTRLLNKLHIGQFTKSRPRRTNDNALVESKNASVVRKHFGYAHLPARFAPEVNRFAQHVLSPYLNFHRLCHFPTEVIDPKGRARKRYRYQDLATPTRSSNHCPTRSATSPRASPSSASTSSPTH